MICEKCGKEIPRMGASVSITYITTHFSNGRNEGKTIKVCKKCGNKIVRRLQRITKMTKIFSWIDHIVNVFSR